MPLKTPYTLVRMTCSDAASHGREFDLVVELHHNASLGVRAIAIQPSRHLRHGQLVRPGQPMPARPAPSEQSFKNFRFSPDYPGCPYCHRTFGIICDCGTLSCGSEKGLFKTCAGCGRKSITINVDWIPGSIKADG
jgi:hypothetical protein